MKYFLIIMFFLCNLNMNKVLCNSESEINQPYSRYIIANPIVVKMGEKNFTIADVFEKLNIYFSIDLKCLSEEKLLQYIHLGKKIIILEEILSKEMLKKGKTCRRSLLEEIDKEFSLDQLKQCHAEYEKNYDNTAYRFSIMAFSCEKDAQEMIDSFFTAPKIQSKEKIDFWSRDYLNGSEIISAYGVNQFELIRNLKPGGFIKTRSGAITLIFYLIDKGKFKSNSFDENLKYFKRRLTTKKFVDLMEDEIKAGCVKFYSIHGQEEKGQDFLKSSIEEELFSLPPYIYGYLLL